VHPLFDLSGRVALVTGASRGLGRAIAAGLAGAGADVVAAGHATSLDATCADVRAAGRACQPVTADLADRHTPARLLDETIARFGHVDVLVCNAGIIRRTPAAFHADEDWDTVIEVNLTSVFRLARTVGAWMLESKRPGRIIFIASLLSFQGGITVPGYAAAKGGVAQLTKALANEWAPSGINVNAIAPGYMRTDNTTALREDPVRSRQILDRIPAGRWGEPTDLVGAVIFLASPASSYVSGHVLAVDGGWLGR
jgi:2-dehydro-3-deoxy-D-gluconate 5-dehydrogenase